MRSEGFLFYFGGLGVEAYSLDSALVSATVRTRLPAAVVGEKWPCLWRKLPYRKFQKKSSLLQYEVLCEDLPRGC